MMRTSHWLLTLLAAVVVLPSVASAQSYYYPAPAGAVPPHVYIRERVRWHLNRRPPVVVIPAPAPRWVAPGPYSPPPPPVYVAPPPPPPVYVTPQPVYVPPPQPMYYQQPQQYCCVPPAPAPVQVAPQMAVVQRVQKPQWTSRLGLGVTGEGMFTVKDGDHQGFGVGGQLRYRAARHLTLELAAGYQRSNDSADFVRTDIPMSFGLMIPFLGPEHALSPYIVGAAGINLAKLRLLDAPTLKIDDERTMALAQVGFGLELRLGQRFALNADARVEGRWALNEASEAVANTTSINGKPVTPIQDTIGLRVGVGATIYF